MNEIIIISNEIVRNEIIIIIRNEIIIIIIRNEIISL
jgi:hypothetical protein